MTIIFFHGMGGSVKLSNYEYDGKKYKKNNFIKQLQKIDKVIVANIPYTHIYYYGENKIFSKMYMPVNKLNIDDLYLDTYITKFHDLLNTKKYPSPYIVIGHSHGIYYAMEFSRQYHKKVKEIVSLDGSWITKELCENRLNNWKKKGKIVEKITSQKELDTLVELIKTTKDNTKYIQKIFDSVRYDHTLYFIKNNFPQLLLKKYKIKYTVFRDFNGLPKDVINDVEQEFNLNAMKEDKILKKYKTYKIFWLLNAGHYVWFDKIYKKQIIDYLTLS